jgi:EamA-like transporter family
MNKIVLAHAAAATAALSAGAAVVATRFVIGETDPVSLVFYRYVISVICFAPSCLRSGREANLLHPST